MVLGMPRPPRLLPSAYRTSPHMLLLWIATAAPAVVCFCAEPFRQDTDAAEARHGPSWQTRCLEDTGAGCGSKDESSVADVLLLQTDVHLSSRHTVPVPATVNISALGTPSAATSVLQTHQSLAQLLQSPQALPTSFGTTVLGLLLIILAVAIAYVCCHSSAGDEGARASLVPSPGAQRLLGDRTPGKVARARGTPRPLTSADALRPTQPTLPQADFMAPGPPPICPSLILPNTEARFKVSMDSLLRLTTGDLDVLGTSGRKLLHASVRDAADGRRVLSLASVGCEGEPRCTICAPLLGGGSGLDVYGRGSQFYGNIEATPGGGGILRFMGSPYDGAAVMTLDPGNPADLALTASTVDGRRLATGGRSAGDEWKLQVKQGADAVLIGSCMLAMLLLRPSPASGPGHFGSRPSAAPSGPGSLVPASSPGLSSPCLPGRPSMAP